MVPGTRPRPTSSVPHRPPIRSAPAVAVFACLGVFASPPSGLNTFGAIANAAEPTEAGSGDKKKGRAAKTGSGVPPRMEQPEPRDASTLSPSYSVGQLGDHLWSVRWELAAVGGALAVIGLADWGWGDSNFRFIEEGWFAKNTRHGGMDKIGHAFSTFVIADLLTDRIRASAANSTGAQITGSLLAFGIMGLAETLDGFAGKHRFSREDIAANAVGAAFSMIRNTVPGMREKLDWRLLYTPASYEKYGITTSDGGFLPPYERQRYVMALKGSGFAPLKSTPLRYAELHVGFDARGFENKERALRYPIERTFYVGVGLNLNEVLFGAGNLPNFSKQKDTLPARVAQKAFEYIQVPYTATYGGKRFSTIRR
ncbi:Predicted lipoprotein [Bosea lathyri]|uniref:Predicted lipoprotein n=2 Tax=Bosea lathyri TaxID=1036778 RepID=A0A1H6BL20_9HYPH|nr:Predicted lipoprotein [Bosea lathyri]